MGVLRQDKTLRRAPPSFTHIHISTTSLTIKLRMTIAMKRLSSPPPKDEGYTYTFALMGLNRSVKGPLDDDYLSSSLSATYAQFSLHELSGSPLSGRGPQFFCGLIMVPGWIKSIFLPSRFLLYTT